MESARRSLGGMRVYTIVGAISLIVLIAISLESRAQEGKTVSAAGQQREDKTASKVEIRASGAKSEEETRARLRADALLAQCVIKPVMTDEEINLCKQAYRLAR